MKVEDWTVHSVVHGIGIETLTWIDRFLSVRLLFVLFTKSSCQGYAKKRWGIFLSLVPWKKATRSNELFYTLRNFFIVPTFCDSIRP